MSEFSDRLFVAGSLVGLRAFSVDSLGRLRGPSFDQIFRPGENEAECRKGEAVNTWVTPFSTSFSGGMRMRYVVGMDPSGSPTFTYHPSPPGDDEAREARLKEEREKRAQDEADKATRHSVGCLECSCGFYAYFDGRNDYKQSDRVSALIEGYGVCTVGTSGFRASKARLVALVRPGGRFNEIRAGLIERNYPDVPVYDRKRDALIAHPLSTDTVPSPDAEGFWQMEAKR